MDHGQEVDIEWWKQRVKQLESALYMMDNEKSELVANFQESTNILIERIKSLEERLHGIRPQTANIFGNSSDSGLGNSGFVFRQDEQDLLVCYNCQKKFSKEKLKQHTIVCYRHIVKCKKCGEYLSKSVSFEHLVFWRNIANFKTYLLEGEIKKAKTAISHDYNINSQFKDLYNYGILHVYLSTSNKGLFELVRDNRKLNPNLLDIDGNTALMLAVIEKKEAEFNELLQMKGLDLSIRNVDNKSALFLSIEGAEIDIVKSLLDKGAAVDSAGEMVEVAQKTGQMELVTLLLGKGATLKPIKLKVPKPPIN